MDANYRALRVKFTSSGPITSAQFFNATFYNIIWQIIMMLVIDSNNKAQFQDGLYIGFRQHPTMPTLCFKDQNGYHVQPKTKLDLEG
jgi:hypothetical protein